MNGNDQVPSPTFSRTPTAAGGGSLYIFRCIQARIGVAIVSPILFIGALFMLVLGVMVARILDAELDKLQRIAADLQIANYAVVLVVAIIGLVAAIRRSLKAAQLFTAFLIAQLPFGIVAGAFAMRMIFKAVAQAKTVTIAAADGTTFTDVCSDSLAGLDFLCQWVEIVKPVIVVLHLEFWIWEIFSIYAAIVYCRQLSNAQAVKILEEDDA